MAVTRSFPVKVHSKEILAVNMLATSIAIHYTRCYFNVRWKADMSRLNLPHSQLHYSIIKSFKSVGKLEY